MRAEEKIDAILYERLKDTWAGKFQLHSETLSNFLNTFNDNILEFELELRRRGETPDLTKMRRLVSDLQRANEEVRKTLVTVTRSKGI